MVENRGAKAEANSARGPKRKCSSEIASRPAAFPLDSDGRALVISKHSPAGAELKMFPNSQWTLTVFTGQKESDEGEARDSKIFGPTLAHINITKRDLGKKSRLYNRWNRSRSLKSTESKNLLHSFLRNFLNSRRNRRFAFL